MRQNSLRGHRPKPSSLGGSSTHATLDRTGSPVRLESDLSSPQEVAEDLSSVKSKGRELEEENTDQGRSKSSVEIEKEEDIAAEEVKEERHGGDEEEFKEGEESDNESEGNESDRKSCKPEGECFVEKQNEERSDGKEGERGRSREDKKDQTDSEEEMVEVAAVEGCSDSAENVERRSFSKGEPTQRDEEGLATRLSAEGGGGGAETDEESAALKAQTPQEGESVVESGSARAHPAEAGNKSDPRTAVQRREALSGALVAEVRFSALSVCSSSVQPAFSCTFSALDPTVVAPGGLDPILLIFLLHKSCSAQSAHCFACAFNVCTLNRLCTCHNVVSACLFVLELRRQQQQREGFLLQRSQGEMIALLRLFHSSCVIVVAFENKGVGWRWRWRWPSVRQ